ncbi:MAG: LOG family protein [Spirochaetes bacterium DG_61]|jgi:uncharacterized protein (TIGR00730 family)|nr:MAG: LOG family protein [Spirochaetes bacterium DG_61]
MKRICVFCGSSPGGNPGYLKSAQKLAHVLVKRKIGLVYGGSRVGIMGEIAKAVLEKRGEVIGVIPKNLLAKEVAFTDIPELRVVETMHERKALMMELSDGFIAMPGGLGTIEEFFEVLTWAQLGIHTKPCGLLNVCHYYEKLLDFLDHVVSEKFIEAAHRSMLLTDDDPDRLLKKFKHYRPPVVDKAEWALRMTESF